MSSLRDQITATLREVLDHQIVAEWICCDPVNPNHGLCLSGYQTRLAVRTLLEEDEDNVSLPKILDALEAAVRPELDAKDTELQIADAATAAWQQRAELAEGAIARARRACDDIEAEAHHLYGDGNKPSNQLGRANGLIQAANRIRAALNQTTRNETEQP